MHRGLCSLASFLVVGGCSGGKEEGALKTAELVEIYGENELFLVNSRLLKGGLSEGRRSPAAIRLNDGKYAVVGGCSGPGSHLNTVEVWQGESFSSVAGLTVGEERSCAAFCTTQNGKSLILGGYNGLECLRSGVIVNGGLKSIVHIPAFISRLKNATACELNGNEDDIIVIGGWDEHRTLTTVFRLSLTDCSSTMIGLLPRPLEGHASIPVDDVIFVFGGYDGVTVVKEICMVSSTGECQVVEGCQLDIGRENHVALRVLPDVLVIAGGWDGRNALSSLEIFIVERDENGRPKGLIKRTNVEGGLQESRIRPVAFNL